MKTAAAPTLPAAAFAVDPKPAWDPERSAEAIAAVRPAEEAVALAMFLALAVARRGADLTSHHRDADATRLALAMARAARAEIHRQRAARRMYRGKT